MNPSDEEYAMPSRHAIWSYAVFIVSSLFSALHEPLQSEKSNVEMSLECSLAILDHRAYSEPPPTLTKTGSNIFLKG